MAILSNRNDYKFVNPVPNDIIIDGGILPARDAAQDDSWKILRGEDPAFILEATSRLDYSTNNFPRATIAVDWTPYVAQFKSNASPAYFLNEMDKHIRSDRLMQPFYTLRDLWQTGCCASGFMTSSEVRERTSNWGSSWNTSLPYVANVPLPDWNQGSPIANYFVKWSGNTYLVADQLREMFLALKMMNHPTATGYGVTRVNGQAGTLPHSTTSSGPNGADLL